MVILIRCTCNKVIGRLHIVLEDELASNNGVISKDFKRKHNLKMCCTSNLMATIDHLERKINYHERNEFRPKNDSSRDNVTMDKICKRKRTIVLTRNTPLPGKKGEIERYL